MKRKITVLLSILMIFTLILSGCGGGTTPDEPSNGNENQEPSNGNETEEPQEPARDDLIIALEVPVASLDPLAIAGIGQLYLTKNIYDTLVELDENLNPVPSLAESWTISDDGLSYTFKLREDVKFSNGEDLTSDDVVFSFNRLLESPIGVFYSQFFSSIEKIDEYTVIITTPVVFEGTFISLSQLFSIVSKDFTESMENNIAMETVGSGPFIVKEFVPGSHVKLESNENYFGGTGSIKELTMKFIPDSSTRSIALESGEVDFITSPSPEDRQNLLSLDNIKYDETLSNFRTLISLTTFGNLQDEKLREAITYAINVEEIFEVANDGVGQIIPGTFSPVAFPDYFDLVQYTEFDIEIAKEILAESSYEEGTVINITLTTPSDKLVAEIIQNQLSKIGISTNIEIIEVGTYYSRIGQGDVEIAIGTGGGAVFGPQEDIGALTTMQDHAKRFPDNEEIDNLYVELTQTSDKARRIEIVKEVYEIVADMHLTIPLFATNLAVAYDENLKGVKLIPDVFTKFNTLSW